jgi:hypothetical protein
MGKDLDDHRLEPESLGPEGAQAQVRRGLPGQLGDLAVAVERSKKVLDPARPHPYFGGEEFTPFVTVGEPDEVRPPSVITYPV